MRQRRSSRFHQTFGWLVCPRNAVLLLSWTNKHALIVHETLIGVFRGRFEPSHRMSIGARGAVVAGASARAGWPSVSSGLWAGRLLPFCYLTSKEKKFFEYAFPLLENNFYLCRAKMHI